MKEEREMKEERVMEEERDRVGVGVRQQREGVSEEGSERWERGGTREVVVVGQGSSEEEETEGGEGGY